MFRVQIEAKGQIAYQIDVSSQAYARFEAKELAYEHGDAVKVEHESDLARYETPNGLIRTFALRPRQL